MDLIRKMVSLIYPKSMLECFEELKAEEGETLMEISVQQKSDGDTQRLKSLG